LIPDVKNRVKEGKIHTAFNTCLTKIEEGKITVENLRTGETSQLPADFVLILTGYTPDAEFLRRCGLELDPVTQIPTYDKTTFETNVSGLYVCGTVMAGITQRKYLLKMDENTPRQLLTILPGVRSIKLKRTDRSDLVLPLRWFKSHLRGSHILH